MACKDVVPFIVIQVLIGARNLPDQVVAERRNEATYNASYVACYPGVPLHEFVNSQVIENLELYFIIINSTPISGECMSSPTRKLDWWVTKATGPRPMNYFR